MGRIMSAICRDNLFHLSSFSLWHCCSTKMNISSTWRETKSIREQHNLCIVIRVKSSNSARLKYPQPTQSSFPHLPMSWRRSFACQQLPKCDQEPEKHTTERCQGMRQVALCVISLQWGVNNCTRNCPTTVPANTEIFIIYLECKIISNNVRQRAPSI